jgi:hypothetical protein
MVSLSERITPEWRKAFLILTETGEIVDGFLDHLENNPDDQRVVDEALAIEEARLSGLSRLRSQASEGVAKMAGARSETAGMRLAGVLSTRAMVGELWHRAVSSITGR